MGIQTTTMDDSEWEDLMLRLAAFTRSLAKNRSWFRGPTTSIFLEGKEAEDYALEAILRHLEHPEKFDPEKGSLVDYLKYNVIRSLVSNDLSKKENTSTVDVFARDEEDGGEEDSVPYSERIMPYTAALFPDDLDYAAYKAYIEGEISGDQDAERILLGIYTLGMKRREIIAEFNMTEAQYDNGVRRLNTAINKTAAHFKEKRYSA